MDNWIIFFLYKITPDVIEYEERNQMGVYCMTHHSDTRTIVQTYVNKPWILAVKVETYVRPGTILIGLTD